MASVYDHRNMIISIPNIIQKVVHGDMMYYTA